LHQEVIVSWQGIHSPGKFVQVKLQQRETEVTLGGRTGMAIKNVLLNTSSNWINKLIGIQPSYCQQLYRGCGIMIHDWTVAALEIKHAG